MAGAGESEQAAVSEYAMELGLCFQIVDDILNATSTREALGKSAGSDAELGKATFVGVCPVFSLHNVRIVDLMLEKKKQKCIGIDV